MKNNPQPQSPIDTIQSLCDAYNAGNLTVDEMVRRSAPLLLEQRLEEIIVMMCQLMEDNPGCYDRNNRDDLWDAAEKIYAAKVGASLRSRPHTRDNLAAVSG